MKDLNYMILNNISVIDLSIEVSKLRAKGWKIYGPLMHIPEDSSNHGYYTLPLIRKVSLFTKIKALFDKL